MNDLVNIQHLQHSLTSLNFNFYYFYDFEIIVIIIQINEPIEFVLMIKHSLQ